MLFALYFFIHFLSDKGGAPKGNTDLNMCEVSTAIHGSNITSDKGLCGEVVRLMGLAGNWFMWYLKGHPWAGW